MKPNILFVDDEKTIREDLQSRLPAAHENWTMVFADGVDSALLVMKENNVDIVITDISMPGKDGFDLINMLQADPRTQPIPIIVLTGHNDHGLKHKALDNGAADFLSKPVDVEDLIARVRSLLRLQSFEAKIILQKNDLENQVRERTVALESARMDLVWQLGKAGEYRDTETGYHVVRVGYFCRVLAEYITADNQFTEMIFLTSPLHDIGKIGIPDAILLKPGKLTDDEMGLMKTHCNIGAEILRANDKAWEVFNAWGNPLPFAKPKQRNPFLDMAATIVISHHERWDGTGYPRKLVGDAIPLEGRIAAVADVYDALSSDRPYKKCFPEEKVLAIMREGIGSHFDPMVFSAFEKSLNSFREILASFSDVSGSV